MEQLRKDPFTERLLAVYKALVNINAFGKKKDFIDAIKITQTHFYMVETRQRNFPADEKRRSEAILRLFELWGINPEYLRGKTEKVFLKEPAAAKEKAGGKEAINFKEVKTRARLETEVKQLKSLNTELKHQLLVLQEEMAAYQRSKSDNNPDK